MRQTQTDNFIENYISFYVYSNIITKHIINLLMKIAPIEIHLNVVNSRNPAVTVIIIRLAVLLIIYNRTFRILENNITRARQRWKLYGQVLLSFTWSKCY